MFRRAKMRPTRCRPSRMIRSVQIPAEAGTEDVIERPISTGGDAAGTGPHTDFSAVTERIPSGQCQRWCEKVIGAKMECGRNGRIGAVCDEAATDRTKPIDVEYR